MENSQILYGLVPILGVVVGATLQYWFSRSSESRKHQQNLRTNAYVDFIQGVAGVAIAQKSGNLNEQEFLTLLTDAKARISIYGNKEVIEAMAKFFQGKADLANPKDRQLFISICQAIRRDSQPGAQNVSEENICWLLFGSGCKSQ